jgi:hypothetical protein
MRYAKVGAGQAVHIVDTRWVTVCGKSDAVATDADAATCKVCLKHWKPTPDAPEQAAKAAPAEPKADRRPLSAARIDEPTPEIPAVAEAPKPKAKKTRKSAAPKATKRTEPTKVFASGRNAEAAAKVPGVRWAGVVRATGALTASVNCAEYGLVGAADKWMALCITHDQHEFHATHRDAWTARRRPADWCDGCAAAAAEKDAEAAK